MIRYLFILAVTATSISAHAFNIDDYIERNVEKLPAQWWANITAGRAVKDQSVTNRSTNSSGLLSFNGALNPSVYGTAYSHHVSSNEGYELEDRGIMLGYRKSFEKSYFGLSTGLAASHYQVNLGSYYGATLFETKARLAVPVQLQAFWTPFKHVGFGVTSHVTLCKEIYGSVQLGFQVYT